MRILTFPLWLNKTLTLENEAEYTFIRTHKADYNSYKITFIADKESELLTKTANIDYDK